MAEPGWYNAAGDPAGTQRYWDGSQWLGDAVFEPTTPQPVAAPPPPTPGYAYAAAPAVASTFPGGLKAIAIVLSVLKAIPLAIGGAVLVLFAAIANDFDEEFGEEFSEVGFGLDGVLGAAILVLVVIFLVAGLLIGFQFVGALKERPMMVFVPAAIMSLFDGFASVGAWLSWNEARNSVFLDEGPGGPVLMTLVLAAQVYVAVQALRANNA